MLGRGKLRRGRAWFGKVRLGLARQLWIVWALLGMFVLCCVTVCSGSRGKLRPCGASPGTLWCVPAG